MKTKRPKTKRTKKVAKPYFPKGWDQKRVQAVIDYYDNQTDEESVAEYEAAMDIAEQTMMLVPNKLVPEVRRLIARHESRNGLPSK